MGLSIHFPYLVETRKREEETKEEGDTFFSRSQKADFREYLSRAVSTGHGLYPRMARFPVNPSP